MRKLLAICDGYAGDYDIIFNADKSKSIVFVRPNRRFLVKAMNSCVFFYIGGNLVENVSLYVHLGHVITAQLDDLYFTETEQLYWPSLILSLMMLF